jgi:beta-fructofuranosidase
MLAVVTVLTVCGSFAAQRDDDFIPLFDGKTFKGWYAADMSWWTIQDGAITGTISQEKPCNKNQYVFYEPHEPGDANLPLFDTKGVMHDFELKITHRITSPHRVNGGFQYRSAHYKDGDCKGYQIDNNTMTPWLARMYDEFGRHTLAWRGERTWVDGAGKRTVEKIASVPDRAHFSLDKWHEYHLVCRGTRMTLSIDGQLVAEVFDGQPSDVDLSGLLAPQLHSGPPMVVQFKNILYKPLPRGDSAETPPWPEKTPPNWLTYHLVHPGPGNAMPGDPNPAFYYKGRYHLHYIYKNKTGFVFAHVSSKDMVHWKWHPTVLGPTTTGHGMFSGTGFFTKEGKPAMIYHGQGSGRNWIAYALDDNMEIWTTPQAIIPINEDGSEPKMRHWDPDCWLNGDTYYSLSGGKGPQLMKSPDLKNWKYLGDLLHEDYPVDLGVPKDEDISCANMFKIGNKWMLLCISHPLGCRYYLGDFKNEKYLPDFHAMMNWKKAGNYGEYFAPESLLTADGRRVMWAWLRVKAAPTGIQALPRELELAADGMLRIKPLRELETLRFGEKQEKQVLVKSDASAMLKNLGSDAVELKLEFEPNKAKEYGLDVLCNKQGENGLRIAVIPHSKTLKVGTVHAPFELKESESLTLRVFIDKNLVEVFANDRQAVAHALEGSPLGNTAGKLFAVGADVEVKTVTSWQMKTIYSDETLFKR